jgi:NTE family protein
MQFDLVFEGGGIRGIVFVGALREFARRGHTPGRIMGTSAGAITATALAVGYDADDMFAALTERSEGQSIFTRFLGQPQRFDPRDHRPQQRAHLAARRRPALRAQ